MVLAIYPISLAGLEAAIDSGCQPLSFYGNSTKWQGNKTNWILGAATCNVKLDMWSCATEQADHRDNVGGWRKLPYFVKWRWEERLQVVVKLEQLHCYCCSLLNLLCICALLLLDCVLWMCLKLNRWLGVKEFMLLYSCWFQVN